MKIGVTCSTLVFPDNITIYSNGHHFNVLLWYHFFEKCGFEVVFISDKEKSRQIVNCGRTYNVINYMNVFNNPEETIKQWDLDCLFIAGLTDGGLCNLMKKFNVYVIYSMMGNNYIHDIDTVIYDKGYNELVPERDIFDEIWVSPHFEYSIEYYKLRYGMENILVGPYIWSDYLVKGKPTQVYNKGDKLNVAICEPNICDKKNCMIPICICEKGEQYIEKMRSYCSNKLRVNKYFVSFASSLNIHKKGKAIFNNRNIITEILNTCNCVVSTTQEWDLNYVFLECFYFGIPLIHNSKMLEEYGYYYPDLDINKAVEQIKIVFNTHDTKLYIEKHKPLLHKYSMDNTYYQEWVKSRLINHDKKLLMLENNTMTEQQINNVDVPLAITYCNKYKTHQHKNTQKYVNTLENNDWDYKIIGNGEIWKGFAYRMKYYRDFLQHVNPNKIVVITDAHDVYCTRSPTHFIKEFKKYNRNMIVSMEMFAERHTEYYPEREPYFQVTYLDTYFKHHNIDPSTIYRKFVNAGLITGYAKDICHFYTWALDNHYTDDQKALGAYMNAFPDTVYADTNIDILHSTSSFVNIGLQHKNQMDDAPTFAELIGRKSFFLHLPGTCIKGVKHLYENIYNIIEKFNSKEMKLLHPNYDVENFERYWTPKTTYTKEKTLKGYQFIVVTASNERKQLMEEQFSTLNLPVDVHYLEASIPSNSQAYLKDCGKEEREYGVLCCTRSHIRALEYASQNKDKYEYSIILEDDVAFLKNGFLSKIEEVIGNWNKYENHKIVSIGWVPCGNYETYTKFDETLSDDTIKIITDRYFPGTQGYIVKNDDIPYMDSLVRPTYIEMDDKLKTLNIYKELATHFGEKQNTVTTDVLINRLFKQAIVFPPLMIEMDIPSMLGHNNINNYWATYFKGHETERDKYRLSTIKTTLEIVDNLVENEKQPLDTQYQQFK